MRILGLDGGIASTGWAIIEVDGEWGRIESAGARTFESPEEATQKGPKLKNADRRMYRGQRRVVRRRAQRMAAIRSLFETEGLIAEAHRDALEGKGASPWELRAEALDRRLEPLEWALALGHIAIHRGFRSNSKRDKARNAADETSKMLVAIDRTREKTARYRTVGEMFARDPEYLGRRRNRSGDFTRSILRDDQAHEVATLFTRQRELGNDRASEAFQEVFSHLAFSQRPLQSSEDKVGDCLFEQDEKRTARFAPSFELFRFLSRLTSLRLETGPKEAPRPLSPQEIAHCADDFGKTQTIKFAALRKKLDLDANTRFAGISTENEKHDVAARTGAAAMGTAAFRTILQDAVGALETSALIRRAGELDRAAEIITFNEDLDAIKQGLTLCGLSEAAQSAILAGVEAGKFKAFKGAGHISAKAARAIIPFLREGLAYSEACERAGYDHSARAVTDVGAIRSPVARKALFEMLKQVKVLDHEFGPFDAIHVEMARDIGKSIEERAKIKDGIDDATDRKEKLRAELKALRNIEYMGGDDLIRCELWKEQNGRCLYSDAAIDPNHLSASDNLLQVDHILPWSRFGDDSFLNKTLCFTSANAEKGGQTPHEWFMASQPDQWERFVALVETSKAIKGLKKRNYLLRNATEVEQRFRERNLNDTRYATRVLLAELKRIYFRGKESRVAARPGKLTSKLRQAWGVERLKKNAAGERLNDDRHHALDAIVIAATSEHILRLATDASKKAEARGCGFDLRGLPEPWPGFRAEAETVFDKIFVSRAEIRRARGKAHDATINQLREVDGETKVFTRKAIENLTEKDLDLIPVPKPYGSIVEPEKLRNELVESLRLWIAAGKPKQQDQLPRSSKGDIIRKVRVEAKNKPAVLVRGGTADRGDMVRVDVFAKVNKRGNESFYLVPIYTHEAATFTEPPNRAVQQGAVEQYGPAMNGQYRFLWSIYHMSLLKITKPDGEIILGYFRGLDRDTGALKVSDVANSSLTRKGIGARTLKDFKKLSVDRVGRLYEIASETRTWRGKACISPSRDG